MRVEKWDDDLAVRLPNAIVELLGLKEGDDIEIQVTRTNASEVARGPSREELLDRLQAFRGSLPADFKFDREEANSR